MNSCSVSHAEQSNVSDPNDMQLFSCSWCIKSFRKKHNLKRHLKVHTEEKPYNCSLCDKSFADSERLKIHLRVHTGEKPFSCSECSKTFAHIQSLKHHKRIHTGEKPFSCSVLERELQNSLVHCFPSCPKSRNSVFANKYYVKSFNAQISTTY